MKKIILSIFFFFSIISSSFAVCTDWASVSECLNQTKSDTLVWTKWDYKVEWEFKNQISTITKTISILLSLMAVWAIAFAWLKMTLSRWKDEDVKKAKDIIKWTIIWYLALISVWAIVSIVVNIIYWIWW